MTSPPNPDSISTLASNQEPAHHITSIPSTVCRQSTRLRYVSPSRSDIVVRRLCSSQPLRERHKTWCPQSTHDANGKGSICRRPMADAGGAVDPNSLMRRRATCRPYALRASLLHVNTRVTVGVSTKVGECPYCWLLLPRPTSYQVSRPHHGKSLFSTGRLPGIGGHSAQSSLPDQHSTDKRACERLERGIAKLQLLRRFAQRDGM